MTAVVKQKGLTNRFVTVRCPLCTDGTRIVRDCWAWRIHMEGSHSATADSWTDTGERGGQAGPADEDPTLIRIPYKCYGCGATFATKALLVAHLASAHGAS